MLLSALNITKTFGTKDLFTGISLSLAEDERLALIGPNGSGKSTLLKILAKQQTCDAGSVNSRKGVRVAYVSQQDTFAEGATVLSAVLDGLLKAMKAGEAAHLHDEHEAELAAELALARHDLERFDQPVRTLSGGQRKRLAIIREIAKEPDALLLDEPTNHLDLEGVEWLEETLRAGPFASAIVTHDREFLETVATRIAELSQQYPQGLFEVDGNYSEFLRRKQEFLDGQARQEQALANQVREDLRWLGRRAKARRTKSKSRIDASHDRIAELEVLRARNAAPNVTSMDWAATGRMTRKLLVARAISKKLGERQLFTDLDLVLSPGQRLGLMGPNGSGKSTLIKVLIGELEADEPTPAAIAAAARTTDMPHGTPPPGTIKRAEQLRIVLFSQHRSEIPPGITLAEALSPHSDGVVYRDKMLHINTWARKFLFNTQQLKQPVRALSGGEQARIHIARLMLEPADVLILDEPTNDLDIPSLEVLEESLEEFPGSVVLVTHDRAMLARLCTHFLALDGKGGATHHADYEQWERAHEHAAREARAAEREARGKQSSAPAPASTEPAAPVASASAPPAPPAPALKKVKLSYKEQRELDQVEPAILEGEEQVAQLAAQLDAPDVARDPRKLHEASVRLSEAQARVAKLYERWTELEAKQRGE